MEDKHKNRIEKMERSLYSRDYEPENPNERSGFSSEEKDEPAAGWTNPGEDVAELLRRQMEERHGEKKIFKRIFWGALAFFVVSLGVAAFMFFGGGNTVSSGNIDIDIKGPTTTAGGSRLDLTVSVHNGNNVPLESAVLEARFPAGTLSGVDGAAELARERMSLGTLAAGGKIEKDLSAILYGEKDSLKEIVFTLEYRLKDSSALFYKEKRYEISIQSSPLIMLLDYPKEVSSGQDVPFTVSLVSNTDEVLRNVALKVEYPFGFKFRNANPKPATGNNLWNLGDFKSGEKKVIEISGSIEGQNEEERTFRFISGVASGRDLEKIASEFTTTQAVVTIKKPFIDLSTTINGSSSGDLSVRPGERVQANVVWTNNLPNSVFDAVLEVKFSGSALDRDSVAVLDNGFFRSVDNTIVWNKNSSADFREVVAGSKGAVSFSFSALANLSSAQKNQDISLEIKMSGNQVVGNQTPQTVEGKTTRILKLISSLSLNSRSVRSVGPFENSGPIPPKADSETTYTIIWTLGNSLNDVTGVKVAANLPPYVKWKSLVSPDSEKITYNQNTGELVWNVGDVGGSKTKEVAFQIGFVPSLNQIGSVPTLVESISLTGKDTFTGRVLSITRPEISTRYPSDPTYKEGDAQVIK